MRRYETIVIVDPDVGEEQRATVFDRIRELIPQENGILVKIEDWGTKKLAYMIKKKIRGFYSCIDFCGSGSLVDEIERFFRIDDKVLKFMTVLLKDQVDLQQIQEEIALAAAQKEIPASEAEAATESIPVETTQAEATTESTPVEKNQPEGEPIDATSSENNKEEF